METEPHPLPARVREALERQDTIQWSVENACQLLYDAEGNYIAGSEDGSAALLLWPAHYAYI